MLKTYLNKRGRYRTAIITNVLDPSMRAHVHRAAGICTVTHPGRVLLHLMLVAMRAANVAAPEAALAELITTATEAAIAEAGHPVGAAVRAGHRMED